MDFDRFRAQYDVHVNEVLAFSGTEQEFYLQAKAEQVERLITGVPRIDLRALHPGALAVASVSSIRYCDYVTPG